MLTNPNTIFYKVESCGSPVVNHMPHHPKVEGSIPANLDGNRRAGNGFGSLGLAKPSLVLLNTLAYVAKSYYNISQG
jgi:hypothetical protein